ncbi:MAG: YfhO family protein [Deltaproteobacteria bacterium]|nr:YfhO family protein [Deltaproteobacteria bacterium]
MTMPLYILLLFAPLLFLSGRRRKETVAAAILIAVFIIIHARFIGGRQTVTWDTLAWSMGLQHVKNLFEAGYMPGWNPYFNSGEPLYIYHYAYAYWQWFIFAALDRLFPLNPVALFNVFFVFLFIFYNVGCYLVFRKVFKDARVALFCLAVSLFSMSFVVYFGEHSSFYVSIYFPYVVYFFLEFVERRSPVGLALIPALFGIAASVYVPHFLALAFMVFAVSYFIFMDRPHYTVAADKKTIAHGLKGCIVMLVLILPVLYVYHRFGDFISPSRTGLDNLMSQDPMATGHHQEYRSILNFFAISNLTDARTILYVGIAPFALAGVGAFKSANRFRWTVLVTVLVIFFINLGRNSFPYLLIHYVPTFGYMRQYIIFEIFVQFFVILLAGMGLEYLLTLPEGERKKAIMLVLFSFGAILAGYCGVKYKEVKTGAEALLPGTMYVTFFILSVASVIFLIRSGSERPAYLFLMTVVVLTAGTFQWYLGELNYENTKHTKDSGEVARLTEVLGRGHRAAWMGQRRPGYEQRLRVNSYNTFEPVLDGVETDFIEPVEHNLLVNKRYYDLAPLRKAEYEFFGVDSPKLFLTDDYRVERAARLIPAMKEGYPDYLLRKTVWFSEEDLRGINGGGNGVAFANDAVPHKTGTGVHSAEATYQWRDEFDETKRLKKGWEAVSGLGDWSVINADKAGVIDIGISSAGKLTIGANGKKSYLWESTFTGPFVYRELTGDFDIETRVTSNHHQDNELAGIVVRAAAAGGAGNWISFEAGSSGGKDVLFMLDTVNGASSVEVISPGDEYLRVMRLNDSIRLYSRHAPNDDWMLRAKYARPDLGPGMQVGLAAHPDNAKGEFVARFDYFRVKDHSDGYAAGVDPVKVDGYAPDRLSLSVDAARPSFLVYLQNYDKDWQAYVNGAETPILRVNYNFQAVPVPKGKSAVEFRYSSIYKYLLGAHLVAAVFSVGVMAYACRKGDKDQ